MRTSHLGAPAHCRPAASPCHKAAYGRTLPGPRRCVLGRKKKTQERALRRRLLFAVKGGQGSGGGRGSVVRGTPRGRPPAPGRVPLKNRKSRFRKVRADTRRSRHVHRATRLCCPADGPWSTRGGRRFQDDPDTPDTGNGTPPIVDMGAYEVLGLPCLTGIIGGTEAADSSASLVWPKAEALGPTGRWGRRSG